MEKITIDGVTLDVKDAIERYKTARPSAHITERQAAIFEERFGVTDGTTRTYDEVGRKFDISRERVRQLCAKVLHEIGLLS